MFPSFNLPFELRSDPFAKVGKRKRLDVHRVSTRKNGIGILVFTVLFERNRSILRDHKLRAILVGFEFAGNTPEAGLNLFPCSMFAPDFQRERSGSIAGHSVDVTSGLLRASLAH